MLNGTAPTIAKRMARSRCAGENPATVMVKLWASDAGTAVV